MKSCEEIYQDIQSLIEEGRTDDAIRALEELLQSHTDFARAHYDLGTLYWESGAKDKALEHCQASLNLEPGNLEFCKTMADLYCAEPGNIGKALKLYQKIIEANPNDMETLMILGNLNVVENRFDTAEHFYRRILEIEPGNQDASSLLEKLTRRKQQGTAVLTSESRYQKSQALFQAGNIEEAIKELEHLVAIQPEFALAHNDLGVLCYQCGLKDKALLYYQEAVRLEPANLVYQKNLADLYYVELGRIQDALEIYLNVLKEEPTDIETLMAAGHICLDFNRTENARVFYNRVLDLEPWNAVANDMLEQINATQAIARS